MQRQKMPAWWTGLNFLKISCELRDLGIFIMLGFYTGGLLLR